MSPCGLDWERDNCVEKVSETDGKNEWGGHLMRRTDENIFFIMGMICSDGIITRARSVRARRSPARRTALKMLPRKEKKAAANAKMLLRI